MGDNGLHAISNIIVLVIISLGAIVFGLSKLGIFKTAESKDVAVTRHCSFHPEIESLINAIKSTQNLNLMRHEQHEKDLLYGKGEFRQIREKLSQIGEDIAVLIHINGGIPPGFNSRNRRASDAGEQPAGE